MTLDYGSTANDPLFYLNGSSQAVTEFAAPTSIPSDGGQWTIGSFGNTIRSFDGLLGESAAWNVILTATEVANGYAYGPLAKSANLQIYWPFWAATATDYSGNGRDGTITGAVYAAEPPIPSRPLHRRGIWRGVGRGVWL